MVQLPICFPEILEKIPFILPERQYSPEVMCAVNLPIPKKTNMYQYLECTAVLISIRNVEKY